MVLEDAKARARNLSAEETSSLQARVDDLNSQVRDLEQRKQQRDQDRRRAGPGTSGEGAS